MDILGIAAVHFVGSLKIKGRGINILEPTRNEEIKVAGTVLILVLTKIIISTKRKHVIEKNKRILKVETRQSLTRL